MQGRYHITSPKLAAFAVAGIAVIAILLSLVHVIPDRAMTYSAMGQTSVRIELYLQQHGVLPDDLAGLLR